MSASASSESSIASDRMNALSPFDFHQRTRLIFGGGTLEQLAPLAQEIQARRILLVTDAGLRKAGHCERTVGILESAGISSIVFDDVSENPTTDDVDRCVAFAKPSNVDLIIGLGGGSSMDCAKGARPHATTTPTSWTSCSPTADACTTIVALEKQRCRCCR